MARHVRGKVFSEANTARHCRHWVGFFVRHMPEWEKSWLNGPRAFALAVAEFLIPAGPAFSSVYARGRARPPPTPYSRSDLRRVNRLPVRNEKRAALLSAGGFDIEAASRLPTKELTIASIGSSYLRNRRAGPNNNPLHLAGSEGNRQTSPRPPPVRTARRILPTESAMEQRLGHFPLFDLLSNLTWPFGT